MAEEKMPPIHPGEILLEEFMMPLKLKQSKLARDLKVPATRIHEIIKGERAITADTAARLARYFNMTPEFWLNLQTRYELDKLSDEGLAMIKAEVEPFAAKTFALPSVGGHEASKPVKR